MRASDSPRTNGATCPDMGDFNRRYLTTEHGKRLYWFPEQMGLVPVGGLPGPPQVPLGVTIDSRACTSFWVWMLGAVAAGGSATAMAAMEDKADGEVRSWGSAVGQAALGSTIGAVTGGVVAHSTPCAPRISN